MPDIEDLQHFPSRGGPIVSESDVTTVSYRGILVTSNGSAHTKGTYVTMIASTAKAAIGLVVSLNPNASIHKWMVDIATGAAASEVVLIPNLFAQLNTDVGMECAIMFIPCNIPAGTRISARCQDEAGGQALNVTVSTVPVD